MKFLKYIKNKLKIINTNNINIILISVFVLLCFTGLCLVISVKNVLNPNLIKDKQPELTAKKDELSKQISLMFHELNELAIDINADYNNYIEKHFLYNQFQKSYMTMQKSNASGVYFKLNTGEKDGFYIHNNASSFISDTKEDTTLLIGPSDLAKANDISLDTEWMTDFWTDENDISFYSQPIDNAEQNIDAQLSSLFYFNIFEKFKGNKVILVSIPLISDSGVVYGTCGLELSYEFLLEHLPYDEDSGFYYMLANENNKKDYDYKNTIFLSRKDDDLIEEFKLINTRKKNNIYTYMINDNVIYSLQSEIKIYPQNNVSKNKNWNLIVYSYKQNRYQMIMFLFMLSFAVLAIVFYVLCLIKIRFHRDNINISFDNENKKSDYVVKDKEELELFEQRLKSLTKTENAILKMHIDGFSTEDILETRKITPNTLKSHNNKIYSKMDVKNKSQLISYYFNMRP